MAIAALVVAVVALIYAYSVSSDLAQLQRLHDYHVDDLRKKVEQLSQNGLTVADRKALDALWDAQRPPRFHDDG